MPAIRERESAKSYARLEVEKEQRAGSWSWSWSCAESCSPRRVPSSLSLRRRIETNKFVRWCHMAMTAAAAAEAAAKDFPGYF